MNKSPYPTSPHLANRDIPAKVPPSSRIWNAAREALDGGNCTGAFQRSLDECGNAGGGTVRVPPGTYCCSTLHIRSRTTLVIEPGAVIRGMDDPQSYASFLLAGAATKDRWNRSLLLCDGVEDVVITGGGTIDGGRVFDAYGEENMRGPHTIMLHNSRRVRIDGIRIVDSANYAIMFYDSDEVDIHNVTVEGGWDGVHFRGNKDRPCRDVTISRCRFYTGDDAIAGRYWQNTVITGCVINSSCNGIRLIGPAVGLIVHDCLIYGPGRHPHRTFNNHRSLAGILLQPGSWDPTEGDLDDVSISNITMHRVETPLAVMLKPGNRGGRLTVSRLDAHECHFAASSFESWANRPFDQITMRDAVLDFDSNVAGKANTGPVETPHLGIRPLPAWALYARNVRRLALENVRFSIDGEPLVPAFACEKIAELILDGLHLPAGVDPNTGVRRLDHV